MFTFREWVLCTFCFVKILLCEAVGDAEIANFDERNVCCMFDDEKISGRQIPVYYILRVQVDHSASILKNSQLEQSFGQVWLAW